ncbi:hypothetical protein BH10BDE1_BH10BDE1_01280 [soil metagenome]
MKTSLRTELQARRFVGAATASAIALLTACASTSGSRSSVARPEVRAHALRLAPGRDVLNELKAYVSSHHLKAASIVSAVGSLKTANFRFANQSNGKKLNGHFEVTGMSGVIAESGAHVHASIADETGKTSGGHLLEGNLVYTTLEVVILEYPHLEFARELDSESGYKELVIKPIDY